MEDKGDVDKFNPNAIKLLEDAEAKLDKGDMEGLEDMQRQDSGSMGFGSMNGSSGDFGGGGSVQLNANKAIEDKSIYDANIKSEDEDEDGRLDMLNVPNKEKVLEEQEENTKAVFKPLLQDFGGAGAEQLNANEDEFNKEKVLEGQEENDKAVFDTEEEKLQLDRAKYIEAEPDKNGNEEELLLDKLDATDYKAKLLMFAEIKFEAELVAISYNAKVLVLVFVLYVVSVLSYIDNKEQAARSTSRSLVCSTMALRSSPRTRMKMAGSTCSMWSTRRRHWRSEKRMCLTSTP